MTGDSNIDIFCKGAQIVLWGTVVVSGLFVVFLFTKRWIVPNAATLGRWGLVLCGIVTGIYVVGYLVTVVPEKVQAWNEHSGGDTREQ